MNQIDLTNCDALADYGASSFRRGAYYAGSVSSPDPFLAWCYELGAREARFVDAEKGPN